MSIVYLGTSEFAAAVLEQLVELAPRYTPALVVSRPASRAGRGLKFREQPVVPVARKLGVEVAQPENVNDPAAVAQIGALVPEVVIVCAFGALIREPLLSDHRLLNAHPSLLPRWRGAAPIERAIMAGDEQTGVSVMQVTAGLDSGPVWRATAEPIRGDDTYGTLAPRLQGLAARLLADALHAWAGGNSLEFAEQDERLATYAEKIGAADRLLDPGRPAVELERVVRALYPHIGARLALPDGTFFGVRAASVAADAPAGEGLYAVGDRLLLACSPGALELLEVQPSGGRPMAAAAFLRGHGLPAA